MDNNIIRSIIFLVAGLIVILFPEQLYKFQSYILKKLHIKHKKGNKKEYLYLGIIFIVISIILFLWASLT